MADTTILIIEDEQSIRNFLRATLKTQGYRIVEAATGREGLSLTASHIPDIVILDLGLPDVDGVQVIEETRAWSAVPILVLSARDQERDKIDALDAGADDYLTKPFGTGELLARLRVAMRHSVIAAGEHGEPTGSFRVGELTIDTDRRLVLVGGETVHLTPTEYRLLLTMAQHAGKVLTHSFLLREIWGPNSTGETQYLRVFMANLRRKLEHNPAEPEYIYTEMGVGYRLRGE